MIEVIKACDGILEVSIPMREPSEKAHTIPIARKD